MWNLTHSSYVRLRRARDIALCCYTHTIFELFQQNHQSPTTIFYNRVHTQWRSKENLFTFNCDTSMSRLYRMCHANAHTCAVPKISFPCKYIAKKCLFVQHLQSECLVSTQLSKRNKPLIELSHTFVHTKCRHCSDFATNNKFKALALKSKTQECLSFYLSRNIIQKMRNLNNNTWMRWCNIRFS